MARSAHTAQTNFADRYQMFVRGLAFFSGGISGRRFKPVAELILTMPNLQIPLKSSAIPGWAACSGTITGWLLEPRNLLLDSSDVYPTHYDHVSMERDFAQEDGRFPTDL